MQQPEEESQSELLTERLEDPSIPPRPPPFHPSPQYHHHHPHLQEHIENGVVKPPQEIELASKTIQFAHKRFYLDIKENVRGRFFKITEVLLGSRKSRVIMDLPTAEEFLLKINKLCSTMEQLSANEELLPAEVATQGGTNSSPLPGAGSAAVVGPLVEKRIQSEVLLRENRRYYLDLKINQRGVLLRISMLSLSKRSQILIPGACVTELRDNTQQLLQEYSMDGASVTHGGMESLSLRIDNRILYFDVGSDTRGMFLRISEVSSAYRTAITVPADRWSQFRDYITQFVDQWNGQHANQDSNLVEPTTDEPTTTTTTTPVANDATIV